MPLNPARPSAAVAAEPLRIGTAGARDPLAVVGIFADDPGPLLQPQGAKARRHLTAEPLEGGAPRSRIRMRHHDQPGHDPEPHDPATGRPGPVRECHRARARTGEDGAAPVRRPDGDPRSRPPEDGGDQIGIPTWEVDEVRLGEPRGKGRIGRARLIDHRDSSDPYAEAGRGRCALECADAVGGAPGQVGPAPWRSARP